jgi:hypothetical protein
MVALAWFAATRQTCVGYSTGTCGRNVFLRRSCVIKSCHEVICLTGSPEDNELSSFREPRGGRSRHFVRVGARAPVEAALLFFLHRRSGVLHRTTLLIPIMQATNPVSKLQEQATAKVESKIEGLTARF